MRDTGSYPGDITPNESPEAKAQKTVQEVAGDPIFGKLFKVQTREEAEGVTGPGTRSTYGAVPHFERRAEFVESLPEEVSFFAKEVNFDALPEWKKKMYIAGILLYETKTGEPLSTLAQEILSHYPDLQKEGRKLGICGLSGSGKSTAAEGIRDLLGPEAIIMDSDTCRYNLFAKKVQDAETTIGTPKEIIQDRIHNSISGALYLTLEYVGNVLKKRGYTVLLSGTSPAEGTDLNFYVEHRLVDPRTIGSTGDPEQDKIEIANVAKQLTEITSRRVPQNDDYDWDHAETITDFDVMRPVSVQVPEFVHGMFIQNLKRDLAQRTDIISISNPENTDPAAREEHFQKQIKAALG